LKEFIAETLCQLEMCFSPSYFDIMPHLMMHMVDQIKQLGPVYLHQMWTYEQFMSTLSRYVHNRAYPEGSMIEAYTIEEAVNWCMRYIRDGRAIGLPIHQHEGRTARKGCTAKKYAPIYQTKRWNKLITASFISWLAWRNTLKSTWKRSAPLMTGHARRHGSRTIVRAVS
jgi:hypothetical protein